MGPEPESTHSKINAYLVPTNFLAAAAYLKSWRRASAVSTGFVSFTGISFIISLYIAGETSGVQLLGSMGSAPLSHTLRSKSQRLNESCGGCISKSNYGKIM